MMNFSDENCQGLCQADKRKILQELAKLLSKLYEAYGRCSGSKNAVKILIGSNQEIIKKFLELMQSEMYPYKIIGEGNTGNIVKPPSPASDRPDMIKDDSYIQNPIPLTHKTQSVERKPEIHKGINIQSETYEQERVYLSNIVKIYIDLVIKNTLSELLDEKMKPFFECLNQYEVEKSKKSRMMDSWPDDIQERIRAALDIYNQATASNNFIVRMKMKKIFDKPIVRLVLSHDDANEFANKPIKYLKNDKKYQQVFLESTDGLNDYIAISIGENVYAVFPVKFEPYNQYFAWKRAYPLFFEILPNDELEVSSYILKQPAFFRKKDDRYQMLENGMGCIELVP